VDSSSLIIELNQAAKSAYGAIPAASSKHPLICQIAQYFGAWISAGLPVSWNGNLP